jgi:hypothetical protein
MAKKKRHSRVEIASKLAQANDLVTQGKPQSEIARTLGVSVMTLHRWRKAQPGPQRGFVAIHGAGQPDRTPGGGSLSWPVNNVLVRADAVAPSTGTHIRRP